MGKIPDRPESELRLVQQRCDEIRLCKTTALFMMAPGTHESHDNGMYRLKMQYHHASMRIRLVIFQSHRNGAIATDKKLK